MRGDGAFKVLIGLFIVIIAISAMLAIGRVADSGDICDLYGPYTPMKDIPISCLDNLQD